MFKITVHVLKKTVIPSEENSQTQSSFNQIEL